MIKDKNCTIVKEYISLGKDTNVFDFKDKKVKHNIDTLYFSVGLEGYWGEFVEYLQSFRVYDEGFYIQEYDLNTTTIKFKNYSLVFECKDKFMLCFLEKKSIDAIPELIVQIRSQYLWLNGEYKCVEEIHALLLSMFKNFQELNIKYIHENRIDYAFHTNYIRNMTLFFNQIGKMQVSQFKRGNKYFRFTEDGDEDVDYIAIGSRASNNVFIRIYNKTKEVIEIGYKQFFFQYWLEQGMISLYDQYCYEKCFIKKSYNYMNIARLLFYLDYGSNDNYKSEIKYLISKNDDLLLKELADKLTPKVQLITNVEFQTKRKFYSTLSECLETQCKRVSFTPYRELEYLYKILDNKKFIIDLLTWDVFRLIDVNDDKARKRNKKLHPFWELLRNTKVDSVQIENSKLYRTYQRNLDVQAIKTRLISSISSFSLYINGENDKDVIRDSADFMGYLNENDFEKALETKQRKYKNLKNRLEKSNVTVVPREEYLIVNKADGICY